MRQLDPHVRLMRENVGHEVGNDTESQRVHVADAQDVLFASGRDEDSVNRLRASPKDACRLVGEDPPGMEQPDAAPVAADQWDPEPRLKRANSALNGGD